MYRITLIAALLIGVKCANYNRFDYTTDRYSSQYTTINNLFNQVPYKPGYNGDVSRLPNENPRYPNYNPSGYSTKGYYDTNNQLYPANGLDTNLYNDYSTPRYADGYSSYEFPFMKNERDYCVNRSPQNGIYIDSLMGMWYGVEYIQHLAGDSRVDYARTCIVMHLSEPAEEVSNKTLFS